MSRQLVACLMNVSEGRNISLVEKIAQSALRAVNPPAMRVGVDGWKINASVLNIFQDYDYNRSVITIVAGQDNIGECLVLFGGTVAFFWSKSDVGSSLGNVRGLFQRH